MVVSRFLTRPENAHKKAQGECNFVNSLRLKSIFSFDHVFLSGKFVFVVDFIEL